MSLPKSLLKGIPVLGRLIAERDNLHTETKELERARQTLIEERDRLLARTLDYFLPLSRGVLHIGANDGAERHLYARYDLPVIWVEPIDEVFERLLTNISKFGKQRAFKYLLSNVDRQEFDFKIANNGGLSSSILELSRHKDIWPDVNFVKTQKIVSRTLEKMIQIEQIQFDGLDTLVMDTQGSELLVLKGAGDLIAKFRYLKLEAADFEIYKGCCTVDELKAYLRPFGFSEIMRRRFAGDAGIGDCFDIVFDRFADTA